MILQRDNKRGLISRVGVLHNGFVYEWQTIEPNVMMVRELLKRLEKAKQD
jgi:hypothetical protein